MWVLRRDRRSGQMLYSGLGSGLVLAVMASVTALALATTEMLLDSGDESDGRGAALSAADPSLMAGGRQIHTADAPRLLNPGMVLTALPSDSALTDPPAGADEPSVTSDDDLDPSGTLADWYPESGKTYRTVCVRLCDGAMTPMSFATTRDRFVLDALRCKKSCGSPAALYVQKNPAPDPDALVSLEGGAYSALPAAYRFRTTYDEACTCRPHAWQRPMQVRHRMYAIKERVAAARSLTRGRIAMLRGLAFQGTVQVTSGGRESEDDPLAAAAEKGATGRSKPARTTRRAAVPRAPAAAPPRFMRDMQASTPRFGRRYNGLDWRISILEPL